jgi:hypothetical protein
MEKIRIHPIPTEIVEPALICLPFIPETPITIFFVYFVCYITAVPTFMIESAVTC